MKIKLLSVVVVLIGVSLFPACKHNEIKPAEQELTVEESVPYFASDDEFAQALTAVSNMSDEERTAYEAQHNYQSIGSASEQFYQSIDFESFQDEGDIHQLVAENSDFLQLVEDEDGELMLETRYYNLPYRYLINRDGVAIIGDTVAKFFDSGVFKAHRSQLRQVARLQNVADCPVAVGRFYAIQKITKTFDFGEKSANCAGNEFEWRSTNGKDRLLGRLQLTVIDMPYGSVSTCELLARPYKRTLGVWFWCSRTMKMDATITWGFNMSGNGQRVTKTVTFFKDYVHESKLQKKETLDMPTDYKNLGFDSYSVWLDSYSTSPINVKCP